MATDGCAGGIEWDASVRADHRLSVRHDSEGLAAGQQRTAPGGLTGLAAWLALAFWELKAVFFWEHCSAAGSINALA